jgi:hypothetical protein
MPTAEKYNTGRCCYIDGQGVPTIFFLGRLNQFAAITSFRFASVERFFSASDSMFFIFSRQSPLRGEFAD